MTGKVVQGSIRHHGEQLRFRVVDREGGGQTLPVTYSGTVPDPFRGGREIVLTGEVEQRHLCRRTRHPGDQVPVEVHDECKLASAASPWRWLFATLVFAVIAALIGRKGDERWVLISRRAVYGACALLTALCRPDRDRLRPRRLLLQNRRRNTPRSRRRPSTRWRRCGRARKARCCSGPGCSRSPPRSPSTRPATSCARSSLTRPR